MIGVRSRSGSSLHVGLAAASLLALAACGGAAPGALAPATTAPEAKAPDAFSGEPSTVEQAQDQISAAKAQLASAGESANTADKANRYAPEAQSATGTSSPPSAGAARPSAALPKKSSVPTPADAPAGTTSCGSPCRAIASMRRAVTALCRMTGEDDARCLDAKRTLTESQTRIAPCSC